MEMAWVGTLSTVPKVATTPHGWTYTGEVGFGEGMGVGTALGEELQATIMKLSSKKNVAVRHRKDLYGLSRLRMEASPYSLG